MDRTLAAAVGVDEDRRRLLSGLAALAASALAGPLGAQPAAIDLAALSRSLTGYAIGDAPAASAMLDALTQAVGASALSRIATLASTTPPAELAAALRGAGLSSQAETVVAALFTGQVDTPDGPRVIGYDSALIWQALGWTKPNAWCGGQTDYWSAKPGSA